MGNCLKLAFFIPKMRKKCLKGHGPYFFEMLEYKNPMVGKKISAWRPY